MSFETVENVLNINTDAIMTLAMASILLLIGYAIKNKVNFLAKYCIPAPVIGGFIFMFITFAGHTTGTFTFNFTNTFQDPFMLAFFTTVGLGASFSLLKKGGILLPSGTPAMPSRRTISPPSPEPVTKTFGKRYHTEIRIEGEELKA